MIPILLQCIQFGINEIVPIEMLVEKLKSIYTLDPNAEVNIQHLAADAIDADDATIAMVNDWRVKNGLKPLPALGPTLVSSTNTSQTMTAPVVPNATASGLVDAAPVQLGEVGATGDHGELGTNKPT